jgi:predicted flap endonuclease-1-like 5' DNA nuclease
MFAVKGLPADTRYFSPHPRLVAIIEILLMLLVACLTGYGIGWAIREGAMENLWEAAEELETEKKGLLENKRELTQRLESSKEQLIFAQQTADDELTRANRKSDAIKQELSELRRELAKVKEPETNHPSIDALESEASALRFRSKQLEFQNQELEESIRKLNHELELSIALHARKEIEPVHPFVRPVTEDEKDDLTVIKGIGPFIEKRLNMVGIYTLKQISEFTPETIEQVTKAIEFFPNRMVRDNWVGQAKALIDD